MEGPTKILTDPEAITELEFIVKQSDHFLKKITDATFNWGETEIRSALKELFGSIIVICDILKEENK